MLDFSGILGPSSVHLNDYCYVSVKMWALHELSVQNYDENHSFCAGLRTGFPTVVSIRRLTVHYRVGSRLDIELIAGYIIHQLQKTQTTKR